MLLCIVSCPAPFLHPLQKGSGHQLANSWLCDVSFQDSGNDQSDFFSHVTVTQLLVHTPFGNGISSLKVHAALTAMAVTTERLGYAKLSAEQEEAVLHFLSGQDVFISLPTRAGKSLCYLRVLIFFMAVVPVLASVL